MREKAVSAPDRPEPMMTMGELEGTETVLLAFRYLKARVVRCQYESDEFDKGKEGSM